MRSLVTGGAGFLGSTLVDHLLDLGHVVCAVDDLSSGSLAHLADARRVNARRTGAFTVEHLGVGDDTFAAVVRRFRPEVVHHVVRADDGPLAYPATVVAVADAALAAGARSLVVASAADVYGGPGTVTERAATDPRTPAAAGRLAVEPYLHALRPRGLATVVLVVADAWGPRGPASPDGLVDPVHAEDVAAAFALAGTLTRLPARRLHVGGGRGDPRRGPVLDVRAMRQLGWVPTATGR